MSLIDAQAGIDRTLIRENLRRTPGPLDDGEGRTARDVGPNGIALHLPLPGEGGGDNTAPRWVLSDLAKARNHAVTGR